MPSSERLQLARRIYGAYETRDRGALEQIVAEDFTFFSPIDAGIDRAAYFERVAAFFSPLVVWRNPV